ncbi:MAG: hypothetical protein CMD16_00555 [Flavobacteriales bacterium]|nr:hypothetical protein [Flavobacteriales bacterium]
MRKLTKFTKNIKMNKTLIILSIASVLLYSCKEEIPELMTMQAGKDHLFAEKIFIDIGRTIEKGLIDNGQKQVCPSYSTTNTDTSGGGTLTINFGNTNCPQSDGIYRRGKIIVTYTGRYRDSLSVITTTFDNYYVNSNLIEGEKVTTNMGRNDSGNMWFAIDVNDAKINTTNGTINWQSSRIKEWISGRETYFTLDDDTYKITGNSSGNSVNGNDFSVEITDTLNIDLGCLPYCVIKSGEIKVLPNGYPERIINYGDSICDCNVDVMINGTNYPMVIGD